MNKNLFQKVKDEVIAKNMTGEQYRYIIDNLQSKDRIIKELFYLLDQIRLSGFVSYTGEKPHILAIKALDIINNEIQIK